MPCTANSSTIYASKNIACAWADWWLRDMRGRITGKCGIWKLEAKPSTKKAVSGVDLKKSPRRTDDTGIMTERWIVGHSWGGSGSLDRWSTEAAAHHWVSISIAEGAPVSQRCAFSQATTRGMKVEMSAVTSAKNRAQVSWGSSHHGGRRAWRRPIWGRIRPEKAGNEPIRGLVYYEPLPEFDEHNVKVQEPP